MNMRNFQYLMLIHQFRKSVARIKRLLLLGAVLNNFCREKFTLKTKHNQT